MVGSRVKFSAANCNLAIKDSNCWFDCSSILRKFSLDLSKPFHRAIAFILLQLIPSHQYVFNENDIDIIVFF